MKLKHYIYLMTLLLAAGCAKEELSPVRQDLLGRRVNFSTSLAEAFETRTTYRHDGSFNEGDIMTIYRQYINPDGVTFNATDEAYRVYELNTKYATGTSLVLDTDWRPRVGAKGSNLPGSTFTQTAADSLTWENGKTVRFRSWSRSNLAGAIAGSSSRSRYYPDYCVSEWVTVSGPTIDVPMTLKHQGSRIGITAKAGNELSSAVICLDAADYMWADNSTDAAHDASSSEGGKTLEEAEAQAAAVQAVYEKMCMPSGVDIHHSLLRGMTKAKYASEATDFRTIHADTDGIVSFGTLSPEEIASDVQRPVFCSNDGRLYMISIPYDMSTSAQGGELLTLPPFTRFKIWLYDVNGGDNDGSDSHESHCHIFSLSDITSGGEPLFPNGLELAPGYSYLFSVGYHYDHFEITPSDEFSWDVQDPESGSGTDEQHAAGESPKYKWWQDAIHDAIPHTISEIYNPVFHIQTQEQFLELINLVNGTAATKMSGLTQMLDPSKTYDTDHPSTEEDYRWYRSEDVVNGKVVAGAVPVSRTDAEAEGYIFYDHYHPANADQAAYAREDYLRGPFSFYEDDLKRHFTIYLDNDLDFYDWALAPIGNEDPSVRLSDDGACPFRGVFEGQMHKLTNVNVTGGYLFRHCFDAAIRNLVIETVHDFKLVHTAEAGSESGYGAYIVGVSIKAPSAGNPIATKLLGNSYVVGCLYQGRAGGAMVGTADDLHMVGNMMAADGLPSGSGALLGAYVDAEDRFLAPQTGKKLEWGRFMVNYYDLTRSPGTTAVGGVADAYNPLEYIRGAHSYVLKAKNDNLLSDDVPYDKLASDLMREGFYGLAPWKAMNFAIWRYNQDGYVVSEPHNCLGHYENNNTGYAHSYPVFVAGAPDDSCQAWNVLTQNN